MFTGIIEEIGTLKKVEEVPEGRKFFIALRKHLSRLKMGSSLAINGCCLTVVRKTKQGVWMDVAKETLLKTALGTYKPGMKVNLECPLRLGDLLGGHLVQGHVDAVGKVTRLRWAGDSLYMTIRYPAKLYPFFVPTGSVAMDGVSLTVARLTKSTFTVCLIPFTLRETTFSELQVGSRVNLEGDVLGKYVDRQLNPPA